MRVYNRAMGLASWTSVEDYLPAGNALGYNTNWQFRYSGGEWVMMGTNGVPTEFYPTDSNGVNVQSVSEPCACGVAPAQVAVCRALGYGGCPDGSCEEMPPLLPPAKMPISSAPLIPLDKQLWMLDTANNDPFDMIARFIFSPLCAYVAREEGLKAIAECRKKKKNHKHCDKMGHCVAMCVATDCSGRTLAWCLGWLRDLPFIGDPEDRAANWAGEQCGEGGHECGSCCASWWEHKYGHRPCRHCKP